MLCKQELGFGTPVYCYPGRTGHADGIEDAHRRALLKFVEDLADLATKVYLERKLRPSEEKPQSRERRERRPYAQPFCCSASDAGRERGCLPLKGQDGHIQHQAPRGLVLSLMPR